MINFNPREYTRDFIGGSLGFYLMPSVSLQCGVVGGGIYAAFKQVPFEVLATRDKVDEAITKVLFSIFGTGYLCTSLFSAAEPIHFYLGFGLHEVLIGRVVNAALGILF